MELKETEKRLLEAVSKIIEEEGFTQIGIIRSFDIPLFWWFRRAVGSLGEAI